jgi:hypothetical protein
LVATGTRTVDADSHRRFDAKGPPSEVDVALNVKVIATKVDVAGL